MPELPEVETVRKILEKWLKGRTILAVEVFYDKIIENILVNEFKNNLINQAIESVQRRGKYLLIYLKDYVMISHLRMEGKYFLLKKTETHNKSKHDHVVFYLDNDTKLVYNDVRKFGKIRLVKKDKIEEDAKMLSLGKEPFDLSGEELFNKIHKSNRKIKQILLDQKIISGLGNIYVDETLFLSKINPSTPANKITMTMCDRIIKNSIAVLNNAIKMGGSTIKSYGFGNNEKGYFQTKLYVYGREKQECLVCGETIKKIILSGRGTHFCPKCQK